ncbi:MAG: hypothetical protein AB1472_06800, partial [Candidatus Omnitrophota bacterium]
INKVIPFLDHKSWDVQTSAWAILSQVAKYGKVDNWPEVIDKIIPFLDRRNCYFWTSAWGILSQAAVYGKVDNWPEVINKIIPFLNHNDWEIWDKVFNVLSQAAKCGEVDINTILFLLDSEYWAVLEKALLLLYRVIEEKNGEIDNWPKVINKIKLFLDSGYLDSGYRDTQDRVWQVLSKVAVQDRAWQVLSQAAVYGKVDNWPEVINKIIPFLDHKSWYVRTSAWAILSQAAKYGKVDNWPEVINRIIPLLENENIREQVLPFFAMTVKIKKINHENFLLAVKLLKEQENKVNDGLSVFVSEVLASNNDWLVLGDIKLFLKFMCFEKVRENLNKVFLSKCSDLKGVAKSMIEDQAGLKTADFNLFIYLLSLKKELVPMSEKIMYLKFLNEQINKEKDDLKRLTCLASFNSLLRNLPEEEITQLKEATPEIIKKIQDLNRKIEYPDFAEIFDKSTNPKQKFNVILYATLHPEYYADVFKKVGYKEKEIKKGLKKYTKRINGKQVTICLDFVTDSGKENILKHINNQNCHLIAYAGHTSMGRPFIYSFKNIAGQTFMKKIICVLSCWSARSFYWEFYKRNPSTDFIGMKTKLKGINSIQILLAIINGVTGGQSWEQIKVAADEEIKKNAMREQSDVVDETFFPHENGGQYLYGSPYVSGINISEINYLYPYEDVLLLNNPRFDFEMAMVELDRISHGKPKAAVATVKNAFECNPYLDSCLKKSGHGLEGIGFNIFDGDCQDVCLYESETGNVAVNVGYRNSSQEAITMMLIYDLNLKIVGSETVWDRIRGLQLVAKYVYYSHQEDIFPDFLRKYGYDSNRINIQNIYNTLRGRDKIEALRELASKIDGSANFLNKEDLEKIGVLISRGNVIFPYPRYFIPTGEFLLKEKQIFLAGVFQEMQSRYVKVKSSFDENNNKWWLNKKSRDNQPRQKSFGSFNL